MRKKSIKALLFTIILMVTCLAGCSLSKVSPEKAKEIAVQKLASKYDDSFEVRSVDKEEGAYMMMVYSKNLDAVFPVTVTIDGEKIKDKYELTMYLPMIIEEIQSVKSVPDGWDIGPIDVRSHFTPTDDKKYDDLRSYIKEEVSANFSIKIADNIDESTAKGIYHYLSDIGSLGYGVYAKAYHQGGNPITVYDTCLTKETPNMEEFVEKLKALNKPSCSCEDNDCNCPCKRAEN